MKATAIVFLLGALVFRPEAEWTSPVSAAVQKVRRQISLPKGTYKTESSARAEAEKRNPGFKIIKVIESKTAWQISMEK